MSDLAAVAPAFVSMAHRIVWCTVATVHPDGRPRTRILHPIWAWDGDALTGWIATSPLSPKRADVDHEGRISLTYWDPTQDTCSAECDATWVADDERADVWRRFAEGPEPVGYDPSIIPGWDSPDVEAFGALRLSPTYLRVFPGSLLLEGRGDVLSWRG